MADGYTIHPNDEPIFRRIIQRERGLTQGDEFSAGTPGGLLAVLIVRPPAGFVAGSAAVLRTDPRFPFCYEISVVGYPGFGVLDTITGRIDGVDWAFGRNDTPAEILAAFPPAWQSRMIVTGGAMLDDDDAETVVATGRHFIGFSEQPDEFVVDDSAPDDPRVAARSRAVPFLVSQLVRPCVSLVDTSVPSPIAAGALAFAGVVAGLGLSLLSIEPRVFQELTGVFDINDDAFETPDP